MDGQMNRSHKDDAARVAESEEFVENESLGNEDVTLRQMGYEFSEDGFLQSLLSGERAVLIDDALYSSDEERALFTRILRAANWEVQRMLVEDLHMANALPCDIQNVQRFGEGRLFMSENAEKNLSAMVVLIEGSGTAGQWDPRLAVSDGLEIGSQFPFIRKCLSNGWTVVVLDAGCECPLEEVNSADDEERRSESDTDFDAGFEIVEANCCECDDNCIRKCKGDCLQKLLNTWNERVLCLPPSKIAIVAHHCGGLFAEKILREDGAFSRIRCVCLSDWTLSNEPRNEWWKKCTRITRHWVTSGRPCGAVEKTRFGVKCLSGGVKDPRMVPNTAADNMIQFIHEMFNEQVN